MNTPRDDHRDLDRLLEPDGGDMGALYRRLARLEPPRRLDRAVLGEAARAVRGRAPRRHRWMVGFGSAAGLVLAAGVAWHVGQDALQRQSQEPSQRGMIVVPVEPLSETPRKHAPAGASSDAAMEVPPAAQTAVKPLARSKAAPDLTQPAAPAPASAPVPPPAAAVPFPAETRSRDEAAAPAASSAQGSGNVAAKTTRAVIQREQAAPARLRVPPPALSSSVELRRDTQLEPDAWLQHIDMLLRDGRRQQAIDSLHLFQRRHPKHPLPAHLKALLD